MKFNIGAAFGGFATTISERVAEEEKRVDLLTDKALDLHTRLLLDEKQRNRTNIENAEKLINALNVTGLDLETRTAIAAGGELAVEQALSQFDAATQKGVDFKTVYAVTAPTPGTEEFTARDWASQIVAPMQEPEIATGVMGESRTIFGPDPQKEFKRKLKLISPEDVDKAVGQVFQPGKLKVDLSQLSSAADLYTSTEQAMVGTTQLLQRERNKPEAEQDAAKIKQLEADLVAYSLLDEDGGDPQKIADRIDAFGIQLAELDIIPESQRDDAWQQKYDTTKLTLDSLINVANQIKTKTDLSTEKFATHNAMLVSLDQQIMSSFGPEKAALVKQRDTLFKQILADKKALADAEGGKPEDYTIFSNESITKIFDAAMSNAMPDIVEVGLQGQITTKLKGNEARYIVGTYDAINFVEKSYGKLEDNLLNDVIEQRRIQTDNMLEAYKLKKLSQYFENQQLQTPKDSIEGFYSEPDAATAAEEAAKGKYKVGDVVRTKDPNDPTKYISYMWTGVTFI